jgi:S1-C subfamily serine protease
MKFLSSIVVIAAFTLIFTSIKAQSVDISTNPSNAHVLTEGNSSHKNSPAKTKFEENGHVYVYLEDHLPVLLKAEETTGVANIDLVPVTDLVGDKKTPTLEFTKLVFTMDHNKEIGSTGKSNAKTYNNTYVQRSMESNKANWIGRISEELGNRKLNVLKEEVDLFGGRVEKEAAKFLLAAEVQHVWISIVSGQSYTFVTLKWSLFDQRKRKIVYEAEGYGFGEGKEGYRDHLDNAFTSAATHLTCSEDFLNALMGVDSGDESDTESEMEKIELKDIGDLKLDVGSNLIKRCIESTVTVKTNKGIGSGVVISEDGKILTNEHVINGASSIEVIFNNGLSLDAELLRKDRYYDVALLQISVGKGYKSLPLALGENIGYEIGDDVMAIGTPLDISYGQTVSRGIVSGNRKFEERLFIQTDVSVNSGNSGGPLINKDGRVIGLITWKIAGDSVEGVSFAVPISQTLESLNIEFVE